MKTNAKKGLYIGAALGVVAFAVAGLLPGSFIGGVIGLKLVGGLFGAPLEPSILSRMLVGLFMVLGIAVSGLIFTVVGGLAGWAAGRAVDTVKYGKGSEAAAKTKAHSLTSNA